MRFIYKVLMGLILFNICLFVFTPFFPSSSTQGQDLTEDGSLSSYEGWGSESMFSSIILTFLGVSTGIFAVSIAAGIASQQFGLFLGVGGFISIVAGLAASSYRVINQVTNMADNSIISTLVSATMIMIGIIAVLTIVEMFTAQRGAG